MRRLRLSVLLPALALGVAVAGCGGDAPSEGAPGASGDAGAADAAGSKGVVTLAEPTLTADPGTAWAEVDGGRLTYESAGSLAYVCVIGPERVQVNFQTAEGNDLALQASLQDDRWVGQLTFQPGGESLQYGASLPATADPMVIGRNAVSFEGMVTRVEDFDAANATQVEASVAINCELDEDVPTAVVGGATYTFDPRGAQSFDCSVAEQNLDVVINRLASDGLQLAVSARRDGEDWIGAVVVSTPQATYTSTLPADGTGLTIDGSSVDYEGTFTGGASGDVPGTASVTCP